MILNATVARVQSKRRVNGKQIAGSDAGVSYCIADCPDYSSIDSTVRDCGFLADLEAHDMECRAAQVEPLEASEFVDGL